MNVSISTRNRITQSPETDFFLSPESPTHRQYEALRCYFLENVPSQQAARRFNYSPGAFRVLCHEFRHDPAKRAGFFQPVQRGPQKAPARDRVRQLAVAMRKKNRLLSRICGWFPVPVMHQERGRARLQPL